MASSDIRTHLWQSDPSQIDSDVTCKAFKALVARFERERRTRKCADGRGMDVSHVGFGEMREVCPGNYSIYWES